MFEASSNEEVVVEGRLVFISNNGNKLFSFRKCGSLKIIFWLCHCGILYIIEILILAVEAQNSFTEFDNNETKRGQNKRNQENAKEIR